MQGGGDLVACRTLVSWVRLDGEVGTRGRPCDSGRFRFTVRLSYVNHQYWLIRADKTGRHSGPSPGGRWTDEPPRRCLRATAAATRPVVRRPSASAPARVPERQPPERWDNVVDGGVGGVMYVAARSKQVAETEVPFWRVCACSYQHGFR